MNPRTLVPALFALSLLLAACGADDGPAGDADAGPEDAGAMDGGTADGGSEDGTRDGGAEDGGADGGLTDGGTDGGSEDGGLTACDDRTGGALITFEIVGENLTAWFTNEAFIEQAIALAGTDRHLIPVFEDLHAGSDCDPTWSWHPDPQAASWGEVTAEGCDGTLSFVESDLDYWLNTLDWYCPWDTQVVSVDDRR